LVRGDWESEGFSPLTGIVLISTFELAGAENDL
jgi:hypothetical protein